MTDARHDDAQLELRASDADRDRTAGTLASALAAGRLTSAEHAERLDAADAATTLGDLVPLPLADRVIVRRSARALLIDEQGRLVVFRRTRPGVPLYWTTPGGRIEDADASAEAAMRRELWEELGAVADGASQVFLQTKAVSEASVAVQHFFVARLVSMDIAARTGLEFSDPANGSYDIEFIDLRGDGIAAINLRPPELKDFILANREALLAEADTHAGTGTADGGKAASQNSE